MTRSLRKQFTLMIVLTVLFTIGILSILSNIIIKREFRRYISEEQREKALSIVSNFSGNYNNALDSWNVEFIHGLGMYAMYDGYIIKVYDSQGNTVWDAENHDSTACAQMMVDIAERMEARFPNCGGKFVSYDYDIAQAGKNVGKISISYYSPYFLNEGGFLFLEALNYVFLFVGIVSLIASGFISYVLARRVTRPITKTANIAKQISEGNYNIRFEGKTKAVELDDLATSINNLADSLSQQEKLREQLTADVAHELRTPLTTAGSHLEALIEGVWEPTPKRLQSCYEEIGRLTVLVADLERLAYVESDKLSLSKAPVDLLDAARTVGESFEIEMSRKNLSFKIQGETVWVFADKDRLFQVITNLMSNAIKYTPENGSIKIEVTTDKENVILTVEDNGAGISEKELPFIFERFYRADKSRNRSTGGAGIGLAVVKSIVTAHGGRVTAESSIGSGSRFSVALPRYDRE